MPRCTENNSGGEHDIISFSVSYMQIIIFYSPPQLFAVPLGTPVDRKREEGTYLINHGTIVYKYAVYSFRSSA